MYRPPPSLLAAEETPAPGRFSSTSGQPFAKWIEQLAREGITEGCGSARCCPDAAVTRAQTAVFLGAGIQSTDVRAARPIAPSISLTGSAFKRLMRPSVSWIQNP